MKQKYLGLECQLKLMSKTNKKKWWSQWFHWKINLWSWFVVRQCSADVGGGKGNFWGSLELPSLLRTTGDCGGIWCAYDAASFPFGDRAEVSKWHSDVSNLGSHLNWWLRGQVLCISPVSLVSSWVTTFFIFLNRGSLPHGNHLKWIKYSVQWSKF